MVPKMSKIFKDFLKYHLKDCILFKVSLSSVLFKDPFSFSAIQDERLSLCITFSMHRGAFGDATMLPGDCCNFLVVARFVGSSQIQTQASPSLLLCFFLAFTPRNFTMIFIFIFESCALRSVCLWCSFLGRIACKSNYIFCHNVDNNRQGRITMPPRQCRSHHPSHIPFCFFFSCFGLWPFLHFDQHSVVWLAVFLSWL